MNAHAQLRGGTLYTSTARFDAGQRFLSEDEIRTAAPSVFAYAAHHSRSERFRPIPTIEVVRALDREGFGVVGATQSVARQDDRRDFTKHMLRMRRKDTTQKKVGDTVFEILLKNANDGSGGYDILSGLFRALCLNSLVAMATAMASAKIRHTGDVQHKVVEATFNVLADADRALLAPDQWSMIELRQPEQLALASAAHMLRFPPITTDDGIVATPAAARTNVRPEQLLEVRRSGDDRSDLWTVFNRVQENAIKGGLHSEGRNANGQWRRSTTRQIKGVDQTVTLNRALWTLGEEMARLKANGVGTTFRA